MNKNKNTTQADVSSILRDKLLKTSINDSVLKNSHIPLFSKLGGTEYLKKEIKRYIYNPIFKREEYKLIGQTPPMSLIVYGSSGVGKTFLVHSICQEYKLPIVYGNFESEREVRETFRKGDLSDKSIIFFDNLEALDSEEDSKIIRQISVCLSSYKGKSIIIGSIENNSKLPNLLKYFDNELLIRMPSLRDRTEICDFFSENLSHNISDWSLVAKMTPGCTPRDIKKLFKVAASAVVADNRKIVELADFEKAVKEIRKQSHYVTFDDIGALSNVKEELSMSIIYPSKYPEKFKRLGITKPSGVLLHGPPGCGKTLLAKAVSNMSHCNFLSVRGPELISKFVGDSEKEIRNLFSKARHLQPCVIFFDEIDSLCQKRNKNDFCNRIVNQILTLLDGFEDRGEVYLIAATNRLKLLDKALLRPGRFDKIIEVPLPSKNGCIEIFNKCVQNIPIVTFDFSELPLEGYSGAEIAGIVKEAGLICLKSNFESTALSITKENILEAIDKYKLSKKKI